MDLFNIPIFIKVIPTILFFSVFVCLPSIICILTLMKIQPLKKENKLLAGQLNETIISCELIKSKCFKLQEEHAGIQEFQNILSEAELITKFQQPRLQTQTANENVSVPDKYRFIRSLTEKNISTEEIASILAMSLHEVRQLVTLSRIAQEN